MGIPPYGVLWAPGYLSARSLSDWIAFRTVQHGRGRNDRLRHRI